MVAALLLGYIPVSELRLLFSRILGLCRPCFCRHARIRYMYSVKPEKQIDARSSQAAALSSLFPSELAETLRQRWRQELPRKRFAISEEQKHYPASHPSAVEKSTKISKVLNVDFIAEMTWSITAREIHHERCGQSSIE